MGFDAKDWLRGNPKIKAANSTEYVDGNILIDRLAEMQKILNDPVYFAEKYFYIITLDNGKQLIKLYPKQAEMVRAMCDKQRVIVLAVRQCGKCVTEDTKIRIRNKKTKEIEEITIKEFFEKCSRIFDEISFDNSYFKKSNNLEDKIKRKFIKSYDINDYEIETEDDWKNVTYIHKTIEYEVYELKLKSRNIIKMCRQPYCVS